MSNSRLITSAEASEVLSVSTATIARFASSGRLQPAQRLPGRTGAMLFDEEDVKALATKRLNDQRDALAEAEARLNGGAA